MASEKILALVMKAMSMATNQNPAFFFRAGYNINPAGRLPLTMPPLCAFKSYIWLYGDTGHTGTLEVGQAHSLFSLFSDLAEHA